MGQNREKNIVSSSTQSLIPRSVSKHLSLVCNNLAMSVEPLRVGTNLLLGRIMDQLRVELANEMILFFFNCENAPNPTVRNTGEPAHH